MKYKGRRQSKNVIDKTAPLGNYRVSKTMKNQISSRLKTQARSINLKKDQSRLKTEVNKGLKW